MLLIRETKVRGRKNGIKIKLFFTSELHTYVAVTNALITVFW